MLANARPADLLDQCGFIPPLSVHSFRNWAAPFLDLLYPRDCECCGEAVGAHALRWLCEACARELPRVGEPHCATCGFPFYGELAVARRCPACEELRPSWDEGRTLLRYAGTARPIVQHLKYSAARHILQDVRTLARETPGLADWLHGAVLVPVPLHPRRERERGYNQSALLAAAFVTVAQAQVASLLRRVRDTRTQTRLSRPERAANVNNAFALSPAAVLDGRLTYILIDDVFTTGATLDACATVLRAGGAKSVRVLTLAHG